MKAKPEIKHKKAACIESFYSKTISQNLTSVKKCALEVRKSFC